MSGDTEKVMLIRSLRGTPWTVVVAMVMLPSLHGETEIAAATGYSRKTVRKALLDLEGLGFVNRNGRYEAWILTARARQMVLGETGDGAGQEALTVDAEATEKPVDNSETRENQGGGMGKNYPSKGKNYPSPSSSSLTTHDSKDLETSLTTNNNNSDGEGQKLPFGADGEAAVAALRDTGMPAVARNGKGARDAVEAALEAGWSESEVLAAVQGWLAYADGERGQSVRHPGFFTAARIRQGRMPPQAAVAGKSQAQSRDERARAFIAAAYEQRRAS